MEVCDQCGKPAIVQYGNRLLCVDCNLKFQQAEQLRHNRRASEINSLYAEMEMVADLPPGVLLRMPTLQPPVQGDTMTFNNIRVDRSTIGTINTGGIQRLDIAVTQIKEQEQANLAEALKELTEVVLQSQEIVETAKNEIVEHLSFLAEEVIKPKEKRNLTIAKMVFGNLVKVVPATANLQALWDKVAAMLHTALSI